MTPSQHSAGGRTPVRDPDPTPPPDVDPETIEVPEHDPEPVDPPVRDPDPNVPPPTKPPLRTRARRGHCRPTVTAPRTNTRVG